MKLRHLVPLALLASAASCTTVYAITPPSSSSAPPARAEGGLMTAATEAADERVEAVAEGPLRLGVVVGHQQVAQASDGSMHVLFEVRADTQATPRRVPGHSLLVVDRSGSMHGVRMARAIDASHAWINRLPDDDRVSVIGFAAHATSLIDGIRLDATSRPAIARALDGMQTGGETCLSCGIEAALSHVATSEAPASVVLLSDGRTNRGVVDDRGIRELAHRCRARGISVTTVGIGTQYDERRMGSLAFETNARHHFVAQPEDLAPLLEAEGERLVGTVSHDASLTFTLPEGVELLDVVDRAHERHDTGATVSLGAFGPGQSKTVLLRVRTGTGMLGRRDLVTAELSYRNAEGALRAQRATGDTHIVDGPTDRTDPVITMRLTRTQTASAIEEARRLYAAGQQHLALERLREGLTAVRTRGLTAASVALRRGDPRGERVRRDVEGQLRDMARIEREMGRTSPTSERGRQLSPRMVTMSNPYME